MAFRNFVFWFVLCVFNQFNEKKTQSSTQGLPHVCWSSFFCHIHRVEFKSRLNNERIKINWLFKKYFLFYVIRILLSTFCRNRWINKFSNLPSWMGSNRSIKTSGAASRKELFNWNSTSGWWDVLECVA